MRFTSNLTAILALLSSTASVFAVDHLRTSTGPNGVSGGTWTTSNGAVYGNLNVNEGCRTLAVPGMTDFCIDWANRRAHFYFEGQGKRCMRQTTSDSYNCNGGTCHRGEWDEVFCNWRVAGEKEGE
ncbi:hypothetical protein DFP72DRAFT_393797 [Ephemerocybe angulata]|uniref:Uncharacterized protein n=1 Tax=Ephemerocybe angulata TaxID=980116 RepID=A0A8H6M5H6_9AGAR|nr:hypothetical protein DFP72DRAFT_393797 [Tulosesus angulatus]